MRSYEQCERLAFDENLCFRYYPDTQVYDRRNNPKYIVPISKPEFINNYKLNVQLLEYPYTEPQVLVQSPTTLWMKDGKSSINSLGTSHAYHVFDNGSGSVKICYTSNWNPSFNCITALWRCELWLAAYETHLITGETIDQILNKWRGKHN